MISMLRWPLAVLVLCVSFTASSRLAAEPFTVTIRVDASEALGELKPIWRFFGADEPNYAYLKDGSKLLGELGEMRPKQVFFRAHNLLTSGDGTPALKWGSTNAYTEDADGNPIYDWTILDRIFDAYINNNVRPYVQIGFMPKDLSIRPEPYQHQWRPGIPYGEIYRGWAFPPKDYEKWGELAFQWAKHCVDRYGMEEVETWYWQTWNESNAPYWQGTLEEYLKLHDYAIAGVRRAVPNAKVGGADTAGAGGDFTRGFIEHCLRGTNYVTGERGTPLDFVSFHAKGRPNNNNDYVQMGIATQLREIDNGFRIIASYPETKNLPIVIGESDPEGCAACQGPSLAYRNGTLYSSYTAASFARKIELADRHGVNFEGALTWAFEFEGQPMFAGFRALATGGIDKPVLNVFRMFSKMGGQRLAVESSHSYTVDQIIGGRRGGRGRRGRRGGGARGGRARGGGVRGEPDVAGLASLDDGKLALMVWHYHDDDVAGDEADVTVTLEGLPLERGAARLEHFRVDQDHSNAYTLWKQMGEPAELSAEQYTQLDAKDGLEEFEPPRNVAVADGKAAIRFSLPRQGVSLLVLQLAGGQTPDETGPDGASPSTADAASPESDAVAAAIRPLPHLDESSSSPKGPATSPRVEQSLLVE